MGKVWAWIPTTPLPGCGVLIKVGGSCCGNGTPPPLRGITQSVCLYANLLNLWAAWQDLSSGCSLPCTVVPPPPCEHGGEETHHHHRRVLPDWAQKDTHPLHSLPGLGLVLRPCLTQSLGNVPLNTERWGRPGMFAPTTKASTVMSGSLLTL